MGRTWLDVRICDIRARMSRLGMLVEASLDQTLDALQHPETALCEQIIASDMVIDAARREVERLAFQSLVLYQPLAGRDLRFLASASMITASLERAADNATGIATLLLRILALQQASPLSVNGLTTMAANAHIQIPEYRVTEATIVEGLLALGQQAQKQLRETLRAFECNDSDAARTLWQEDDVVDVCYHLVRHDVMNMLKGMNALLALQHDALSMQRMTYWLWIAHNLERIGDHCTHICERIVFFLEGNVIVTSSIE